MTSADRLSRRSFLISAAASGGSLGARLRAAGRRRYGARRRRRARGQCLDRDCARRHGRHPGEPLGNGPRHPHGPSHAGGRGARMRLGQGDARIRLAGRESQAAPGLGRHVDQCEPLRERIAAGPAPSRRHRARNADRGGRGALGRAGARMPGREQPHHPPAERTHAPLRRSRRGGRRHQAARACQAQGSQGLEADRHTAETLRRSGQDHGAADLRNRRAPARYALRRDPALPGLQGQRAIDR